jgi:cytochrome P450
MRGGWLFSHPDAIRDVLVTHDRSFTKSPALGRARFALGNGLLTNEGESPFGGGSRICVGESFALTEPVLVLATILKT